MSAGKTVNGAGPEKIDRRIWLRHAIAAGAAFGGVDGAFGPGIAPAGPKLSPEEEAEQERERAQSRVRAVTRRPLRNLRSEQYQAVGDATEAFMKLTLNDCENLAENTWRITRNKGLTSNDRDAV